MAKQKKTDPKAPEFTTQQARQAVTSQTAKRVLFGGLFLIAIIAVGTLAIGFSGIADDLSASIPSAIVPETATEQNGNS